MPVRASPIALTDPTGHVPLAASVVGVVLLVVLVVIGVLVLTGWVAGRRRDDARRTVTDARIRAANSALAAAHAADEGWDSAALHAAARDAARALGVSDPGAVELHLVSVDDQPGVEDDRATFTVVDGERTHEIVLGRTAGAWRPLA